jgi:hypothetical protein
MTTVRALAFALYLSTTAAAVLAATPAATQPTTAATTPAPTFPQQRTVDGYALTLHAPQVRAWTGFEQFTASIAFELTPAGALSPSLGTATVTGQTIVDRENRQVEIRAPKVSDVKFASTVPPAHKAVIEHAVTRTSLKVPLDLFLAYVADEVLAGPPATGFNTTPPPIVVRSTPTLLLFVNGKPVPSAVPSTSIEVIVNANWPTFRAPSGSGAYYLLDRDRWLTSSQLDKGWKAATSLPSSFANLPSTPEFADACKAVPLQKSSRPVPQVLFADRPTELVVTDGKAVLEAIPGAGGLQWVKNTESPLFKLGSNWYFLVAGRWFTATNLEKGPWTVVKDLPDAFAAIPDGHARAAVLASVPGTIEARMAALEASLPNKTRVTKGSAPTVEVTYAGEPKFEPIPGTTVARAVNTGYDVLMYQNRYYLVYAAAWYVADSPTGPWGATADVPAALYGIPPSSPAYAVTDVKVAQTSGDEIEYSSTDAYAAGIIVAMGVAYYGTGWYYPPYYYGGIYYPYWGSYGHGSWYNPATGRYGSRSVWYGPYGGYSYTQGYNPRTGRYGYVETAWDGDEWASFGETYNPRTGVGTKTERYYDEDKNKMTTERKVERGDEWVKTERKTDFDEGTQTIERETSQGGSSEVQRTREGDTISSERTITTGDGDTYTATGEQSRGQGSTTITGDQGSMTTETRRNDGRSATSIEGSGGGQGISVSGQGPGRTTIAESGSGDLYAGHDGNVYKKTDDGWQHYENGEWSAANSSGGSYREMGSNATPPEGTGTRQRPAETATRPQPRSGSYPSASRDTRSASQLDRDYAARQRGNQQFQQRAGGMSRGGISRRR